MQSWEIEVAEKRKKVEELKAEIRKLEEEISAILGYQR